MLSLLGLSIVGIISMGVNKKNDQIVFILESILSLIPNISITLAFCKIIYRARFY
jgi:hypothetical protein